MEINRLTALQDRFNCPGATARQLRKLTGVTTRALLKGIPDVEHSDNQRGLTCGYRWTFNPNSFKGNLQFWLGVTEATMSKMKQQQLDGCLLNNMTATQYK